MFVRGGGLVGRGLVGAGNERIGQHDLSAVRF